jgi:hypothetical protein
VWFILAVLMAASAVMAASAMFIAASSAVFIAASVASSIDYCTCCNNVVALTMAHETTERKRQWWYNSAVDGVGDMGWRGQAVQYWWLFSVGSLVLSSRRGRTGSLRSQTCGRELALVAADAESYHITTTP